MASLFPEKSFQGFGNYWQALRQTPARFRKRAFTRSSASEEVEAIVKRSGGGLKKQLGWADLMWFTIGSVIGAGVFVLTGHEAHKTAGPSIILSYAMAGFAAMLATLNYTEFAIEIPVAGGSFAYLRVELGDFIAFVGAGNIILEYVIGGAAVARAWTGYFAALIGKQPNDLRIHISSTGDNYSHLDPIAVAVLILTMLIAVWSTKATSIFNAVASFASMLVIAFIIVTGLAHSRSSNLTQSGDPTLKDGFFPFGAHGVFQAASVLFFSFLGFDAVSTMAEETRNPGRDIPIGLVGAMTITTVIYMLMALTLCLMIPYGQIPVEAPFSYAFQYVGLAWAKYLVSLGALAGMTTVSLVSCVGQSRYLTHIGRTHMISPWFAQISKKTQTPINATICMISATCIVSFFTELAILGNLLSISTLFIFSLVAVGILVRRYYDPQKTTAREQGILISSLVVIIGSSVVIAGYWGATKNGGAGHNGWAGYLIAGPLWVFGTLAIQLLLSQRRQPETWGVPLVPWLPSLTIVVNCFLLGSMDKYSFLRFAIWTCIILIYYFFVGLHASYDAAEELAMEMQMQQPLRPASEALSDRWGNKGEELVVEMQMQMQQPLRATSAVS